MPTGRSARLVWLASTKQRRVRRTATSARRAHTRRRWLPGRLRRARIVLPTRARPRGAGLLEGANATPASRDPTGGRARSVLLERTKRGAAVGNAWSARWAPTLQYRVHHPRTHAPCARQYRLRSREQEAAHASATRDTQGQILDLASLARPGRTRASRAPRNAITFVQPTRTLHLGALSSPTANAMRDTQARTEASALLAVRARTSRAPGVRSARAVLPTRTRRW